MTVSEADVTRKIEALVPEHLREAARATLDRCTEDMPQPLRTRFQLATLKLFEEGGCGGVEKLTEIASLERRDVLAWAENPELMAGPIRLSDDERDRLRALDRAQYRAWLDKE